MQSLLRAREPADTLVDADLDRTTEVPAPTWDMTPPSTRDTLPSAVPAFGSR